MDNAEGCDGFERIGSSEGFLGIRPAIGIRVSGGIEGGEERAVIEGTFPDIAGSVPVFVKNGVGGDDGNQESAECGEKFSIHFFGEAGVSLSGVVAIGFSICQ